MIRLLSMLVVAATTIVVAQPGSATSYAYIADGSNPGHVTVVDVGKAQIATVIDVGVQPIGIAISPDGKFVYVANTVTNGTGPGAVSVIDTASMSVVRTTQVGSGGIGRGGARAIAVSANGERLYVAQDDTIFVLAASTGVVLDTTFVGASPMAIATSPDQSVVYIAVDGGMAVMSTTTHRVIANVRLGRFGSGIEVSPKGDWIYLASFGAGGASTVTSIAASTLAVDKTMDVGRISQGIAVTPDGNRLYVANSGGNTVSVLDPRAGNVVATVRVGATPVGVATGTAGDIVYVTNSHDGSVSFIDVATNSVVRTLSGLSGAGSFGRFVGPDVGDTAQAIEYYHQEFGHYFLTANREEVQKLDRGEFTGWQRTGYHFGVRMLPGAELSPVCRFFSTAFQPKSSHFYAPRGLGCEAVLDNPDWQFEGDVFFSPLPTADGACPSGMAPIYRLFNNGAGGAPNHRFTTDLAVRQSMLAQGYVAEGRGIGVGMCSSGQ